MTKQKETIQNGFQIEKPSVFIPWGIDEQKLINIFQAYPLTFVCKGYYTISATSLNGLSCKIGFHFTPMKKDGKLNELEFFRESYPDQQKSFDEFQHHLEITFGKAQYQQPGQEGFDNYGWEIKDVSISHVVIERFMLSEYVRIVRKL